jgi:CubicO group peptidase (beta-lactamase class C family)
MRNSSYVWRDSFASLAATGYDSQGRPGEREKPKEAGAASSLNTTAKDYALFVNAVLNGKGLSPSMLRQMETPEIAVDPACRICIKQEPGALSETLFWGLGWGIQRGEQGAMLWHWGDNGVFKAFVMADPASKSGVVIFANGQDALKVAKPIIDTAMGTECLAFDWLK